MGDVSLFDALGFSSLDRQLVLWCPIAAAIGGFMRFASLARRYEDLDLREGGVGATQTKPRWASVADHLGTLEWLFGHLVLSMGYGLLLALYFVGMTTNAPASVAKLLALAILVGFAAPRLWSAQEKVLVERVEAEVRRAMNAQRAGQGEQGVGRQD